MKLILTPSSSEVEEVVPPPQPALRYLPEWYKGIPSFSNSASTAILSTEPRRQPTLKKCVPYFDALTFGYIQELWCDVQIFVREDGAVSYEWAAGPQPLEIRDNNESLLPIPSDYVGVQFAWLQPYYLSTPKNVSLLITNPFNRPDLPFFCTSGIIDNSAEFRIPFGRIPFLLKKGFSGVIPAGTPMFQIVPIPLETWIRIKDTEDTSSLNRLAFKVNRVFVDFYRKSVWQRKRFK